MLTLFTHGRSRDCGGQTRRSFLRAGTLGGLALPSLLSARAKAAEVGAPITDKSVVMLCLTGGATHIETFDPKMTAPTDYRSMTGEMATSIPGVTIGGGFPKLARQAHRLAIIRSYRHGKDSHGSGLSCVLQGDNRMQASMGSMYARVAGANHPRSGLPNYSVLTPLALQHEKHRSRSWTDTALSSGTLGSQFNPFYPNGQVIHDMQLELVGRRMADRRNLLANLDKLKHKIETSDAIQSADKFQQQALDVIFGRGGRAFDLADEDPKVVDRYSTGESSLGQLMLMARRVIEAGAGFVTVSSGGWDMHGRLAKNMETRGAALDHAVATFIDDLHERGLNDNVLLVITGDFGRTPRINRNGGRDHWGNLCTLAFAGGGYSMGQVVGRSDAKIAYPAADEIGNREFAATIMHSLIDIPKLRQQSNLPPELSRFVAWGKPIKQLT